MTRSQIVGAMTMLLLAGVALSEPASPELVQVGNLRVETKIEGMGNPPVILESGFTGGLFPWGPIQSAVAKQTLTWSYERAGLGRSDPGPNPRAAEQIARELHALLAAKAIAPPYILVGHSAGGLFVRVFAHLYPKEIAGLVLVDPATEVDYERILKDKTAEDLQKMGMPSGGVEQWRALPESIEQARHSWPLPKVPVVVFTSGKPLGQWPLATPEDMQKWLESHNKLVTRIPGAKHIVIENVDHLGILKEDVVVQDILQMLAAVRAKKN
jgi:pimeloyl-ACP methyl ester carboxylesterase